VAAQLPQELQPLTIREALELRNSHWNEDVTQLSNHVREAMCALNTGEAADKKIEKDFDPIAPGNTSVNVMLYFVLAFGVVFALVGLGLGIHEALFIARAQKAEARVVDLLREPSDQGGYVYRPQLEYVTPGGQTARVTFSTASDPPGYYVGETVPILFDPTQPADVSPDTFWGRWVFTVIFGGVGVLVCVGGAIPFALRSLRRRRMLRLLKEGRPIVTAYHSVEQNTAIEVNGRHPFFLITQWRNPVSREMVHFRSPALWEDPTPTANDSMVTVVVDPDNFHRYLMDLSFLKRGSRPSIHRL